MTENSKPHRCDGGAFSLSNTINPVDSVLVIGDAAQGLETLEKEMTPDEIAEAQRLAREWKAKGK